MRKIRIFEHTSLDGVIEHDKTTHTADGRRSYRTPAGSWRCCWKYKAKAFDMLLSRETYDEFLGYWPNAGDFPMANAINASTKYVVTHNPESLEWGPVKGSGGNIIEEVRNLRSTDGPDLIITGSISLTAVLLDAGLIDEVILIVYPVLLGRGKRPFFRLL